MADREKDRKLDQLLESALSQYSAVEPRPGLETRIMARIAETRSALSRKSNPLHWLWMGAATATLAAIILFGIFPRPAKQGGELHNAAETARQPVSPAQLAHSDHRSSDFNRIAPVRRKNLTFRAARAAEVRREVFPTPTPLSQQEVLLLQYLSHTPSGELLAQAHPDPPPDGVGLEGEPRLFPDIGNQRFSNR